MKLQVNIQSKMIILYCNYNKNDEEFFTVKQAVLVNTVLKGRFFLLYTKADDFKNSKRIKLILGGEIYFMHNSQGSLLSL